MERGAVRRYAPYFLYVLLINVSIVFAIVVIHEAGHAAVGEYVGCTNVKVVIYDSSNSDTFTQMNCTTDTPVNTVALAGSLFIIPYALLFGLLGRFPEKYFLLVVLGFNFMISSSDALIAINSGLVAWFLIILGSLGIILGEVMFIDSVFYRRAAP